MRCLLIFTLTAGMCLLAFACGWVRGRYVIPSPRELVGQHVTAVGNILEVKVGSRYTWALVNWQEVTTSRGVYRCEFAVPTKIYYAVIPPSAGQTVELVGVLSQRESWSANGRPPRDAFEFVGQVRTRPTHIDGFREFRDAWLHALGQWTSLQPDECALVGSLLFGDDSHLSTATKQEFLAAGLLHVLAASGSNLLLIEGFVALLTTPLWRWFRVPMTGRVGFHLVVIWCYAAMCDFQISMVRAAVMSSYRWFGLAAGRKTGPSGSLLWTAALLITVDPPSMLSVSAVLSFVATAAVQNAVLNGFAGARKSTSGRWWEMYLREVADYVRGALVTTLQVELWVFPVLAVSFHQFTPYAVLSNILAEPILMVLLPLALATLCVILLCATASPYLQPVVQVAQGLGHCVHAGILAFLGVVEQVSALPLSVVAIGPTSLWWPVAYGAVLTACYWKPLCRMLQSICLRSTQMQ